MNYNCEIQFCGLDRLGVDWIHLSKWWIRQFNLDEMAIFFYRDSWSLQNNISIDLITITIIIIRVHLKIILLEICDKNTNGSFHFYTLAVCSINGRWSQHNEMKTKRFSYIFIEADSVRHIVYFHELVRDHFLSVK